MSNTKSLYVFPPRAGLKLKKGKCTVFHGLDDDFPSVALVGLGSRDAAYCDVEERDEKRENVRNAVAGKCLNSFLTSVRNGVVGNLENV